MPTDGMLDYYPRTKYEPWLIQFICPLVAEANWSCTVPGNAPFRSEPLICTAAGYASQKALAEIGIGIGNSRVEGIVGIQHAEGGDVESRWTGRPYQAKSYAAAAPVPNIMNSKR